MAISFLTSLLEHYSITAEDLRKRELPGSFSSLVFPNEDPYFQKMLARLKRAGYDKEKVVVYGDYDVDGLTSTAIMVHALRGLGITPGYFIPSRFVEGYGLVSARVDDFKAKGYHLIIAVDNGICADEAIDHAHALGMEVLVIDHHDLPKKLPAADLIFHNLISNFVPYPISAASLCFFLSVDLLEREDKYLETLAGIAVFSDVMPLVGNNLILAKLAYKNLNHEHYLNLDALLGGGPYSYHDINFRLNPMLNSPGRIYPDPLATNRACRFLIEDENESVWKSLTPYLSGANFRRKSLVSETTLDPTMQPLVSEHCIAEVLSGNPGIAGIVAGHLSREKDIPVLVLAPDFKEPDTLIGSIRAPAGYDFGPWIQKNSRLFISAGGHPQACGLTIPRSAYLKVATLFQTEAIGQYFNGSIKRPVTVPILLGDITEENMEIFESFYPFGDGFEEPLFELHIPSDEFHLNARGNLYTATNSQLNRVVIFDPKNRLSIAERKIFTIFGTWERKAYMEKRYIQLFCMAENVLV
ncbi:MAG: DHH family phosphoesterase [Bacilli bacterium]|nr:DHH family phosphoesterase [Bacilli bacterium]